MNPSIILQTEIQNLWKRINSVTGTLREFNDREDKTNASNLELTAKNQELVEKFSQMDSSRQQLEGDCQNLNVRLKTFDEVKSTNAELLRTIADYDSREKNLRTKLEESENSVKNLTSELEDLRREAADMKARLKTIEKLNEENDQLRHDMHATEVKAADFEFAQSEIARKNKELFEKNNIIRDYKDKTSEFESKMFEMASMRETLAKLTAKNEELTGLLVDKDAAIDKLNAEKNESDDSKLAKIDKLQNEIKGLNGKIDEMNTGYKDLYDSKQKVLNQQAEMIDEIAGHISKGEELDNTIKSLNSKIEEMNSVEKKDKAEIARLHGKHDDEVSALLNTITTYKKEKAAVEAKLDEIKKGKGISASDEKMQSLESDNKLLNKQVEEDVAKIEELNGKISDFEKIIGNLNSELKLHKDRDNSIEDGKAEIISRIEEFMKNYKKK